MARSLRKGPFYDYKIINKINDILVNRKKKVIKTWSRRSTIMPEFVGFTFLIHNGKNHIPIYITEDMVGHKLGEFSYTRTFKGHATSKKNKKYDYKKKY